MADKVTIELEVLAKRALDSVEKFSKDSQNQLDSINLNTTISAIRDGFSIASNVLGTVSNIFAGAIREASEAEQAVSQLSNAMRINGELTLAATERANEFADGLSRVTTSSKTQIISALSLASSFGLSNSEARKLVKTATDLAAITGTDLDSAVRQLTGTYTGNIKNLQKIDQGLKALTAEQLAAGKAVDILSEKLAGSATAALNTYAGTVAQARKEVDDFAEAIGTRLIKVTAFLIRDSIALKNNIGALLYVIKRDSTLGDTIFEQVSKSIKKTNRQTIESIKEVEAAKKAAAARISAINEDRITADFLAKRVELEQAGLTEIERINKKSVEGIKLVRDAAAQGIPEAVSRQQALIAGIRIDTEKKILAEQQKLRDQYEASEAKFDKEARDKIQKALASPIEQALKLVVGAELDGKELLSIGAGLLNMVNKGAAGASEFVSKAIGAAADTLFPGIGAAVSEIVNILAQGPEKVRETIQAFVKAVPQIIDNIVQALPVLIETLARELPPVIAKIAPVLAQRLAIELVKNMPTIIKGFADGLVEAAKQFVQAIFDNIKSVGGLLSTSGGGGAGNGKGGVVVRAAKAVATLGLSELIGFAEGGRIPDLPQFAGDRFPAKLSAGEQILSRDLSSKLDAFLSGSQSSTPTVVQITIGQREMARVLLDLNRNGFRTAI